MEYLKKIEDWKQSKALTKELKEELLSLNEEQLKEAFYTNLAFGTGGMRGIMGVGTNRMNVIIIHKATLGFGRYLLKNVKGAKEKGVVIAHDNRFHNVEFMNATADVLTTLGIKVYVFDDLRTTPELSFAVRYLNAAGGINITASHNPKEYNGYKIYNEDGNQLILEESNLVMEEIANINDELAIEIKPNNDLVTILNHDVDEAFYQMVMDTSINKEMDKSNITIVYTPQHGTGYVPVKEVLKREGYNLIEVKEQCEARGDFANTKSPNPEEKSAYDAAFKYVTDDVDFICSNDPDCDRIGIVAFDKNRQPVYLTGNQTGAMLIYYVLSNRKEKGLLADNSVIYNTIVTSPLGAKVAALFNVDVEQTLTGFKYIGDKIKKSLENHGKTFQFGYEESYGYLINPEVRDKDGVQAVMMICEMASFYKHQGKTLMDLYEEIQQKLGYYVESQYNYKAPGIAGVSLIQNLMKTYREANFEYIADEKVVIKEDYLSLEKIENGKKSHLDYEQSNVLRYVFEDNSFIAIRPSGTEPKVKFYFAFGGISKDEAVKRHEKMRDFILNIIPKN